MPAPSLRIASGLALGSLAWWLMPPARAKAIEEVFSEMLALRESDPSGFTIMVVSITLIFSLAFALMFATMGYYVKHYLRKRKK